MEMRRFLVFKILSKCVIFFSYTPYGQRFSDIHAAAFQCWFSRLIDNNLCYSPLAEAYLFHFFNIMNFTFGLL